MPKISTSKPKAFSYVRFSSPEQAKGDSLRRQEELRDSWLRKSGAVLDTSITLRDEGVSAFSGAHRGNPDRHALAAFLQLVQRGRIPRGSYLVVESLDRLSREHIRPALTLLLNLIDAGIRIVQLLPIETVYDDRVEPMSLMMAIMELSRGHSESKMKAERVGAAWAEKKRNAGNGEVITKRLPSWLTVEGDGMVIDKEKAEIVRRIFRMAAAGHGLGTITKRLNADGTPTVGDGEYWARSYINKILSNRAVLGEYQPFSRRGGVRRHAEGDPIPDYFPAVITEDEWHAARAALTSRRQKGGRPTQRLNLFTGLLRDARDGGTMFQANKGKKGGGVILMPYMAHNGVKGSSKVMSFPLETFERAILSCLREINPKEIIPTGDADAANRVQALTGKWEECQKRIEAVKAQIVDGSGEVSSLVEVLRTLEGKRAAVDDELTEAQRAAASPLSAAWCETHSLLDVLDDAEDEMETRTRLRGALRRITEAIWCLFVAKGATRIAAVQMKFAGGRQREYLILHQPNKANAASRRPAKWEVKSIAGDVIRGALDLSRRDHAAKLEKALADED